MTILGIRTDVPPGRIRPPGALVPGMRGEMRSHDSLSNLAAAQYGVVSFRQLIGLGFSKGAIWRMSEARRLCRIHRGVYAVGHAKLSKHGRCLAAVLACGEGAVLSHNSAAWLWGLRGDCPRVAEVTIGGHGHRRKGIWAHRVGGLAPEDRREIQKVPTTSLPRTLIDLAATGTVRRIESMLERAERLDILDPGEIDAILRRSRGHAGAGRLRTAAAVYRQPVFSRARSERLFLALIEKAGLPPPALNTFVAGQEVDAYWEPERFAVEVDGWGTHRTRAAFERDPLRQEDLLLAGISSIRITARRIELKPAQVAQRLAQHLERRRPRH